MSAGVSFNVSKALYKKALENATDEGLFAVGEQAKADSNYFVRVDQGQLKESADVQQTADGVELTYNTDYAEEVYYTGSPSKDVNPHASLMWIEAAYNKFKDDWQKIFEKAFVRKLGG